MIHLRASKQPTRNLKRRSNHNRQTPPLQTPLQFNNNQPPPLTSPSRTNKLNLTNNQLLISSLTSQSLSLHRLKPCRIMEHLLSLFRKLRFDSLPPQAGSITSVCFTPRLQRR